MLKTGISYLKTSFCNLFNLILKSGFFPSLWCEGIITPIHKSGNTQDPSNYRGICINSCLGKLFTSILNNRLQNHVLTQNILHNAQIGFLPNHRTSDHLFTLRTLVDKYVTHTTKGKLYTCFIDFKKAFDSIWHDGLLYKLLKYHIGGKFYDLVKNIYSNTKCSIKCGQQRTEYFNYCKGVRQGCILSPILFNLYLNEIPLLLDNNDTDGILLPNGSRLNCLLYADDLVLISNSAKGLQNALTILSQFCQDWLLNVNSKKTKTLIFQKKCRKSTYNKQHFFINGDKIEIVNNYTYLGTNISSNGNFSINKINLMEKTRRSIFATRRYLDLSKLPIHLANKIFDSLFLPILTYGSEVWGAYDKDDSSSWEKDVIERTHIYFCKQFLGVNKRCPNVACRNELGRLPLKGLIEVNIIKFWLHLENLPDNNLAKQSLQISKEMSINNQPSFTLKINKLCERYKINTSHLNENSYPKFISNLKLNIKNELINHQINLLNTNKKLNFYSIFKKDTLKTEFLDTIKNPLHKKCINKFRLGNHKLHIETGRHTVPKIPENLRICSFCHLDEVENESHLLFSCNFYQKIRKKIFQEINEKYNHFNSLDNTSKILFLFNNVDPFVCRSTAAFVFECMTRRMRTDV